MPDLLENGYVYIAQPPLYGIKTGKRLTYVGKEDELVEFLLTKGVKGLKIGWSKDRLKAFGVGCILHDIGKIFIEREILTKPGRLSERERFVVRMRFGIGVEREHTLAEVAKELGVSLERVRQIQVRALGKLRTPTLRRVVDPFLN